jgi:hypothetical protein
MIAVEMNPAARMLKNIAKALEAPMRLREQDVVYSLVEIRKFLEVTEQKDTYKHLTFYCDWAVHPKLQGPVAQNIVRVVDRCEAEFAGNDSLIFPKEGRDEYFREQLEDTFSLSIFRAELGTFFSVNALSDDITDIGIIWAEFVTCYALAIQECPLKCVSQGLQYVDKVTMIVADIKGPYKAEVSKSPRLKIAWYWQVLTTGKFEHITYAIDTD